MLGKCWVTNIMKSIFNVQIVFVLTEGKIVDLIYLEKFLDTF